MRKSLRFLSTFISLCLAFPMLFSCTTFKVKDKKEANYEVSNQYFQLIDFTPHVITSIGVNGNQGSGRTYEIELKIKCAISLYQYSITANFLSDNNILDSFSRTVTKDIAANTTITVTKEVSYDVYSKTDDVSATFSGKSHDNPDDISGPLNPISYIDLANHDTAMLVGESITLDYTLSPAQTDEQLLISCGDPTIVELHGNTLTAKNVGSTYVSLKATKNNISKIINIRVIDELDFTKFQNTYGNKIESATVSVCCKRYDTNWLGQEKNVSIVTGSGIIIKSIAHSNYFLTDKAIFDPVNISYEHEEWYILDNQNKKYSVAGLNYHNYARIAIGAFTSSSYYQTVEIFDGYAYQGDYAISYSGNPLVSRISEIGYSELSASSVKSNVFYHESGFSSQLLGDAIFNPDGKIIGISLGLSAHQCISVSSIEIRELVDAVFSASLSTGGLIDIA